MTTTEEHRYLTLREAAELLRVHPRTAYRYVEAGLLPAKKLGGLWLVDAEELQRHLAERTKPAA